MNRIRRRRLQAYFTSMVLTLSHIFGTVSTTHAAPSKADIVVEESTEVELSTTINVIQRNTAPLSTIGPTVKPTIKPIMEPTSEPIVIPETEVPKVEKPIEETVKPTVEPTLKPTVEPTLKPTVEPTKEPPVNEKPIADETKHVDNQMRLTNSEIELIALITMGEAEGESREGKRMVIDVILNRMDSNDFPDTVKGVIYQKGQFECTWNGRLNRCTVTDEVRQLVKEEANSRSNSEVLYFRTGHYHSFGEPVIKVGNHYFSK